MSDGYIVGQGGSLVRMAVAMRSARSKGYEANIQYSNLPCRALWVHGITMHQAAELDAYIGGQTERLPQWPPLPGGNSNN